jgi:DNA polymerase III subunit gamma/tau
VSYEPLHHKYRPQTFADLVGQEAIATTLTNAIRSERIAPAYLFTGPRGTGKTSSARILAKSLNCLKQDKPTESPCGHCQVCKSIALGNALDVIEIDAASNTGVDNIREIIERSQFAPVQCRYKVYVVDECHMLSAAAFNALLKTLEEPPKHVVFVLATTDPQRVLPTIISRCQRFDFRRIPLAAMVFHLSKIASQENINITSDAVTLVAQVAQGGLRDAESLLDQLGLLPGEVTVEAVWDLVGAVPERDLMELVSAIASDDSEAVLEQCRHMMDRGREPLVVLQNLAGFYRDLLIAKTAPTRNDLVAVTPPTWKQLCEFAQQQDTTSILLSSQHLKNSEAQIKNTTQPRLWLEVTLLGLLPSAIASKAGSTTSQPLVQRSDVRRQELPVARDVERRPASLTTHTSSPGVENSNAANVASASFNGAELTSRSQPPSVSSQNSTSHPVASVSAQNDMQPSTQPSTPTPATNHDQVKQLPHQQAASTSEQTSPEPIASAVPAAEHSSNSESAIHQIWQQVLDQLQPPATQALLRQHSHLLSFNNSVAVIGISSQPLLKLAQGKLPNIEAAFEAVFQLKVKVTFQTKTSQPSSVGSAKELTSSSPEPKPIPQTATTRSAAYHSPDLTARQVPSESNNGERENVVPLRRADTPLAPSPASRTASSVAMPQDAPAANQNGMDTSASRLAMAQSAVPKAIASKELERDAPALDVTHSPLPLSEPEVGLDSDAVEKALINLKQFFEGEIIELTDDFEPSESAIACSTPSENAVYAATDQLEPDIEEEEESTSLEPATTNWRQSTAIAASDLDDNDEDLLETESWEGDDDIPFVRPVSLRTSENNLQDPWEMEVNQPGIWLYGTRGLYL